jgi:hypothetical protein
VLDDIIGFNHYEELIRVKHVLNAGPHQADELFHRLAFSEEFGILCQSLYTLV